ncbi:hypothetical protein CYMTET_26563 [Cymbomonas tetramitiformis]|uniref:Uncharacterized protein n=1 Tax=Cymbomonas tetramitiformis TaxID=36881 RepID=A0AAE0FS20_9CHLO|nr:hypothetical protein CYMTET_26563 [Cymbomonas tetramitiformis]
MPGVPSDPDKFAVNYITKLNRLRDETDPDMTANWWTAVKFIAPGETPGDREEDWKPAAAYKGSSGRRPKEVLHEYSGQSKAKQNGRLKAIRWLLIYWEPKRPTLPSYQAGLVHLGTSFALENSKRIRNLCWVGASAEAALWTRVEDQVNRLPHTKSKTSSASDECAERRDFCSV